MRVRGVLIVSAAVALGTAGALAAPDEKTKKQQALEKNAREVIHREAHFFALIKSRRPKGTATGKGNLGGAGGTGGAGVGGGPGSGGRGLGRRKDETYAGFLTPKYQDRLYVVGASQLPEKEEFKSVKVLFHQKRGKAYGAEFVGQDKVSRILVFRLKKKTLGKGFKEPQPPTQPPALLVGEMVISLGHPYVAAQKKWEYWQMSFGSFDSLQKASKHMATANDFIHHSCDFGRFFQYWHGGPLVRVTNEKEVEILGINTSKRALHRAVPYAEVIKIRDKIIAEKRGD